MRFTVAFLLSLFVLCSVSMGQVVPNTAVRDWESLDRELSKVSGTLVENRPFGKTETFFAFNGKLSKFESTTESKRGESKEVILANGKYAFRLKENRAGEFLLAEVAAPGEALWLQGVRSNIRACNSVLGFSILEALTTPDFEFTDWVCNPTGICTFKIRCIASEETKNRNEYLDSVLVEVDANAKHRVIRRIESRTVPVKQTVERRYEYGDGILPTRVVVDIKFDGANTITQESLYSEVSKEVPPSSEFELTHYGLPNYAAASEPWSAAFTIFIGAIVVGLLAIAISVFGRRRA